MARIEYLVASPHFAFNQTPMTRSWPVEHGGLYFQEREEV